ncbi:hypothetical protein B9Z55_004499 [Caenorhabditis nigoni]|nr:hypothetical protein B9Z55_004499 [Caenorhabditis nigoni]
MELMLRNRKCKINAIIVETGNIYSQIDTKSARDCLSVFFKKSENDQRNPVTQLVQLQDKYQEETDGNLYLTHVSLDEMFSIYSNLTRLFSCPFRKWVIIFDEMKLEEFWQYTERMLKLKFQRFAVHAKTMSNVVLTELMDKIPEKMEVIIDSDIPLDYSHPKALRFRSFKYTEARWLKIEDFFNIRNLCLIILDRTNFDCSDVIKFLNYWSDCDEDMMEGIAMGLKEGTQIDEEEIIKIFIVISDNESSHSRFFIIKLAMSDFKMELILRNRKYKLKAIHIQLGSINPQIGLDTSNEFSAVVFEKAEIDDRNPVIKLVQLRDRYQEDSDDDMLLNHVSLENMFSLYSSLDRLFSCPFYDWLLRLDELDLDEFWKFTKRILSLEFHRFSVNGESMSNDLLRELMDKLPEKAELSVNSGLPLDYNHPKALKFPVIRYTDARWVKIEDLFSIRNVDLIRLERTHFDCGDVNRFLNYWSECDEDMIEDLSITLKEETEIDEQAIFKNLIVISGKNSGSLVFMKARNTRNRKFVVSKLEFRDKKVLLSTWDPFKKDRLYEYSVLKLVHKIRDCEENIQKMENDFRGLRDTEKRKLQLELEELERKLTVLNRDFVV